MSARATTSVPSSTSMMTSRSYRPIPPSTHYTHQSVGRTSAAFGYPSSYPSPTSYAPASYARPSSPSVYPHPSSSYSAYPSSSVYAHPSSSSVYAHPSSSVYPHPSSYYHAASAHQVGACAAPYRSLGRTSGMMDDGLSALGRVMPFTGVPDYRTASYEAIGKDLAWKAATGAALYGSVSAGVGTARGVYGYATS